MRGPEAALTDDYLKRARDLGRQRGFSGPDLSEFEAPRGLTGAARTEKEGDWLAGAAKECALPMPPEVMVRVLHALVEGLVLHRLLTPDLVPDEVFYAAFAALANGGQEQSLRPALPKQC